MRSTDRPKREHAKGHDNRRSGLGPLGIFDRLFGAAKRDTTADHQHVEALTVAVAGGKGGTGKSFFATNLAVLLHQRGHSVTLVDCDFGLACDHLLLGVSPKMTLQHLVMGRARIRDIRVPTPAGPFLVPGASGVRTMTDLSDHELLALGNGLGELAGMKGIIILDVGAGITPQNVLTMLCADHTVLVTEAEIAALTGAYAVVKEVGKLRADVDFSVVVNRVVKAGQGAKTYDKLAEVADRYTGINLGYLGEIQLDPTVTQRRLGQLPLAVSDPEGTTIEAVRRIVSQLERTVGSFEPVRVDSECTLEKRFGRHRVFLSA